MEQLLTEIRQESERVLSGVLIRYGDEAKMPWGGRETFMPGAFGDVAQADVILNLMHQRQRPLARTGGGGLTITDDNKEVRIRADLPRTKDADDALELVRTKVLRGLSSEFAPTNERNQGNLRIIYKARLGGMGLVDIPAYSQSKVEARNQIDVSGDGLVVHYVLPDNLADLIGASDRDLALVMGDHSQPLAHRMAGTLKMEVSESVAVIQIEKLPDIAYAKELRSALANGDEYELTPIMHGGVLTGIAVTAPAKPDPEDTPKRKRKIWL